MLFLSTFRAPTVHAVLGEVAETPNKNWRAFCAVLALELEPTISLSLPPSLADLRPRSLPLGYTQGPLRADRLTHHLGVCGADAVRGGRSDSKAWGSVCWGWEPTKVFPVEKPTKTDYTHAHYLFSAFRAPTRRRYRP